MRSSIPQTQSRAGRRRARLAGFLFHPATVEHFLAGLQNLAAVLGSPHREGEPAFNVIGARKSARELYRVLGNTHYEHLAQLLATIDACAGAGFTQPTLLRTRARRPFVEALAELHVAEHFRRAGFKMAGFDDSKDGGSVPDVVVRGNGIVAAVEVYCPRAWPGLAEYTGTIRDRVKNLDCGLDFEFRIEHQQLTRLGAGMRLLQLHPTELSDGLDERTRLHAIETLIAAVEAGLDAGSSVQARFELPAVNLVTTVEIAAVTPASWAMPARAGVASGPSIGGYQPEAMFTRVVQRVNEKLSAGQAVGVASNAVPVLVVEMSQSELTDELRHAGFYRHEFEKTLDAALTELRGYGVVAFCEAVGWGKRLVPQFLRVDEAVTEYATARKLFAS